jgi:hypothetical protein
VHSCSLHPCSDLTFSIYLPPPQITPNTPNTRLKQSSFMFVQTMNHICSTSRIYHKPLGTMQAGLFMSLLPFITDILPRHSMPPDTQHPLLVSEPANAVHHEHPNFRHVLYSVSNPFAPGPALLHAPIRLHNKCILTSNMTAQWHQTLFLTNGKQ